MKLHHVGIVMRNERVMRNFMTLMQLEEDYRGYVPEWQALCVFTRAAPGDTPMEFIIADTGPLKAFNKGLGGVHHVAMQVDDIRAAMARYAEQGIGMISDAPVKGAGPFLCNFIRPEFTDGALVELVQLIEESAA